MCPAMTRSSPAFIAALNGGKLVARICASVWSEIDLPLSLLIVVSPRPGKCFAVAATPAVLCLVWYPLTASAAKAETFGGRSPNERIPSASFSGLTFTSTTGASSTLIPIARSSWPVMRAACRARPGCCVAPSAMFPGRTVAGGPMRSTSPCSWSVEISIGIFESRWMPFESPTICGGLWRLFVQLK